MAVVVIGSIGGDVVVRADRHPTAGETVLGSQVHHLPGGKGSNQAVAAARAGASTRIAGKIGDDHAGSVQLRMFASEGIDSSFVVVDPVQATQTALIIVDSVGENRIVVVSGASGDLSESDVLALTFSPGDVVVAQFEVPQPTVRDAFSRARATGARTILNAAPAQPPIDGLLAVVDIVVVNETEASELSRQTIGENAPRDEVVAAARALRSREDQVVVITLGARGAIAVERDAVCYVEGRAAEVVDTTGAGDCFVGYFAAALSTGATLSQALDLANAAASLCVQRLGAAAMPHRSEVEPIIAAARR